MAPPAVETSRLDGKVALVTGSGRGIGAAMATELARRGAKVVVNYANSADAANQVVDEIKKNGGDAIAIKADVGDVKQTISLMDQAVDHFGQLDIVCSNSGVVSFGHVKDVTEEEFDRVFRINTRGQFFVAREAYKHLSVGGRIILMGSITGQAKGVPKHAVYSGSKGAIETFVRCMAIDCGDKKITVNCVAPGGIKTDMYHAVCREYIPNGDKLTNDQVDEVRSDLATLAFQALANFNSTVRRHLVAHEPRRPAHRHRPRRLLPRLPGRRVGKRQGHRHRRRCLHVNACPFTHHIC
jgi:tetrahydroxynaphthalene reductase